MNNGVIDNVEVNNLYYDIESDGNYGENNDSYVYNYNYIGGISGKNYGTILNSYSDAEIRYLAKNIRSEANGKFSGHFSTIYISGIAGNEKKSATISGCHSMLKLNRRNDYNYSNSGYRYSNTAYSGVAQSAGISYSKSIYGKIADSYSISEDFIYGISNMSDIERCYYIGEGKPQDSGAAINCYYLIGNGSAGSGWIGLNDVQMQDPDSFEGFDFENVWRMSVETVYRYPQLRSITNGVTKVEIISEPTNEIVVGTTLKYENAVARIYREDGSTDDVILTPSNTIGGSTATTGKKTVTYTYKGASASFEIDVLPVKVNELEIAKMPNKITYIEGQEFDPSGLTVYAIYNNGERKICNDYAIGDVDTKPGVKNVEVSYNSASTSFEVSYMERKVTSLEITKQPNKTVYALEEEFDPKGLEVTATYNDEIREIVNDYTIEDYEKKPTTTITILYKEKDVKINVSFIKMIKELHFSETEISLYENDVKKLNVNVVPTDADNKELIWVSSNKNVVKVDSNGTITAMGIGEAVITVSAKTDNSVITSIKVIVNKVEEVGIEIGEMPTKLKYIEGESIDINGLIVNVILNNGKKYQINTYNIIYDFNDKTAGVKTVKVTYLSFETSFDITYIENKPEYIKITNSPYKKEYIEGDLFDTYGMQVYAYYEDGISKEITDYTVGDFSGTGLVKVKIEYAGLSDYVSVNIKSLKDITWLIENGEVNELKKLIDLTRFTPITGTNRYGHDYEINYSNYIISFKIYTLDSMYISGKYNIVDNTYIDFTFRKEWESGGYSDFKTSCDIREYSNKLTLSYSYSGGSGYSDMFMPDSIRKHYSTTASSCTKIAILDLESILEAEGIDIRKIGFRSYSPKKNNNLTTETTRTTRATSRDTKQVTTKSNKQITTNSKNEVQIIPGVGTISLDGELLIDLDGTGYNVAEKITKSCLYKNMMIADKNSAGKYKITKIVRRYGEITGGTVTYLKPYNKFCKTANIKKSVKIAGATFKVTAINKNAFKNNKKLTKVTIGARVTKIGANAFYGCKNLKAITIKTSALKNIGGKAFKGINKKAKIKLPKKLKKKQVKKYKKMIKKAKAPKKVKITK